MLNFIKISVILWPYPHIKWFYAFKAPFWENFCMGAIRNNGPIEMKFGTCVEIYQVLLCAKFRYITHKSELFMGLKAYSGGDTCMGARWNNAPILTIFNSDRPCTKSKLRTEFHQNIFNNATCILYTRFTWTASQTDGRTDIVKSTQEVILSRTVYFEVGVHRFF